MRREWARNKKRASGAGMLGLWVVLLVTSIGLYYLGDDQLASFASAAHIVAGFAVFAAYLGHLAAKA
ncbi:MAG: hypothetical protein ABL958_18145 [Bdellovibrionia bacterium]